MSLLLSVLHRFRLVRFAWRRAASRLAGARVGADVEIGADCEIAPRLAKSRKGEIEIGARSRFERGVILHPYGGKIVVGDDVFLGPGVVVYGHGGVEIGNDCLIAMHCRILSSEHALPPLDRRVRDEPDILKPTRIGRDVWLGAGVTVLGGATLGDGCVVGAGSVVTGNIPAGAIAVGVPARVIGNRPTPLS